MCGLARRVYVPLPGTVCSAGRGGERLVGARLSGSLPTMPYKAYMANMPYKSYIAIMPQMA
jgi:hypothetical protein